MEFLKHSLEVFLDDLLEPYLNWSQIMIYIKSYNSSAMKCVFTNRLKNVNYNYYYGIGRMMPIPYIPRNNFCIENSFFVWIAHYGRPPPSLCCIM